MINIDSVYPTLFLDCLKLRNFQNPSRNAATVDALEYDYTRVRTSRERCDECIYHIQREASAVARPTDSGNAKASSSGTGNKYGSHAFCFLVPRKSS